MPFSIGFVFIRDYAPRYLVSFYVTMGLACLGIVLTITKVSPGLEPSYSAHH